MPTRDEIVATARGYEGVPFKHAGRSPNGVDCAGLLVLVARDLDLDVVDDVHYRRIPDTAKLRRILNAGLRHKPKPERALGDVLLFKDRHRRGHMYHLGIETGYGFIHAYAPLRRVVEQPWSDDWRRAIAAVFEYPGVTDG